MKDEKYNPVKVFGWVFFVLILVIIIFGSVYSINAGERGVLLTLGKASEDVMQPGLHFKLPLVQSIQKMDIRTQKYEAEATSSSKDLQVVNTKVAVNYSLKVSDVVTMYSDLAFAYEDRIIQPAIQEAVKSATARYTAEALITNRPLVKKDITDLITLRLSEKYMITDEISLTDFQFSDVFDASIEAKVKAEQEALKAINDLERIITEKQQTITRAEADAESKKTIADAEAYKIEVEAKAEAYAIMVIRNELEKDPIIIQYKYLEKWNGILPLYTGMEDPVPFITIE